MLMDMCIAPNCLKGHKNSWCPDFFQKKVLLDIRSEIHLVRSNIPYTSQCVWALIKIIFRPALTLRFDLTISCSCTAQKMKFFVTDIFSKCNQIHRNLRILSHWLKKFVMENFIFCAVLNIDRSWLSSIFRSRS